MSGNEDTVPVDAQLQQAATLCGAGRIDAAEVLCHQVLAVAPDNARALAILGVIRCQQARRDDGIGLLERAVAIQPDYAAAWANLGKACLDAGRLDAARNACRRAIDLNPALPLPYCHLGTACRLMEHLDEAETAFRSALAIDPAMLPACIELGITLRRIGRFAEAAAAYREALARNPSLPEAHFNLGNVLADMHRHGEAVASFRKAITLDPGYFNPRINLGNILLARGETDAALAEYRAAIAISPDNPKGHYNLGNALLELPRFPEAAASLETAIAINPAGHEAHVSLGRLYFAQGLIAEAIAAYRRSLELKRDNPVALSNLALTLNYSPAISDDELFAAHRAWDVLLGSALRRHVQFAMGSPDKPLRIGYVSADFKMHPVGRFLLPVIPAHDRSRFTICCYNEAGLDDDFTLRFRGAADVWRDINGMSDDTVAAMIREDGIDILVDLAGHTGGNRLPVFARKPAPVQMTWAGYIGTTGLSTMDYLISDRQESPDGAERFCTEKIIRLPDAYVCFEPPAYAPPVGPAPIVTNGAVTFGCCNNLAKVTPEVIALWADLLAILPGSRLLLKTSMLQHASIRERIAGQFAAAGTNLERIELLGSSPHRELLDTYNRIDIALDPFPYSGGLTTLEALWMGVPVITLGGTRFCSRHSVTHLTTAGLPEMIAASDDDYIRIAVDLALNQGNLATLRQGLRDRVARSPLCDGKRFTRNLETAYIRAWQRWCAGKEPESMTL